MLDTTGLDDVVTLKDLGIEPMDMSAYSDDEQLYDMLDSDEKWEEIKRKYPNLHTDKPHSDNIWDYYNKMQRVSHGKLWRETIFFELHERDQHLFGKYFNEFREEFRDRGFDVSDPDVLDVCNSLAGDCVGRKIHDLDPSSISQNKSKPFFSAFLKSFIKCGACRD